MKSLLILALFVTYGLCGVAQKLNFTTNAESGAVNTLRIDNDEMNWLLATDGSQYGWVGDKYEFGLGYMTIDGERQEWQKIVGNRYKLKGVEIERIRTVDDATGDIVERYMFANTSNEDKNLTDIGIYVPMNDNYPDSKTCMTMRCHAHVWTGGDVAYVKCVRMNGQGPHLGLLLTEGELTNYDIWERGQDKWMSNFRGIIALCPPDKVLRSGESFAILQRMGVQRVHLSAHEW